MKKTFYIFLSGLFILLSFFNVSCKSNKPNIKTFTKKINNLETYQLTCTLETYFPSGSKTSNITVLYAKPDYYKVVIEEPGKLDKQIIVKNKDGVNVIIPTLNKTFKLNTNWPNHTSQLYLLHPLIKVIQTDPDVVFIEDNNTIIYKVNTKNYSNSKCYANIYFDKNSKLPTHVEVFNDLNGKLLKLSFNNIKPNIKIDLNEFSLESNNNASIEIKTFDRVISYPTYLPVGGKLKDEINTGNINNRKSILIYEGEYTLTIVQKYINTFDIEKNEYIKGDIIVNGGNIYVSSNNCIKYYNNGVEYSLYSNDLSLYDLICVGDSLKYVEEK